MRFQIGFTAEQVPESSAATYQIPQPAAKPRKSVVKVFFPKHGTPLSYFNDQFDLHRGDIVFVDGKLEGLRGRVVDVNYHFNIKVADYKRVIAMADTHVHGKFHMAGSHFVTFGEDVLPESKVATWYMAPPREDDVYAIGLDESFDFRLADFADFEVSESVAKHGNAYYLDNKVVYLRMGYSSGYALVLGSKPYELEFELIDGRVRELLCSCPCGCNCKHMVAAMLQLRETLELIKENYADDYTATGYFAAIAKDALFDTAISGKKDGSFTL